MRRSNVKSSSKPRLIHVCSNALTASASRVAAQNTYYEGQVIVDKPFLPSWTLLLQVARRKASTFIFHQQTTLPSLYLCYFLSRLLRNGNRFAYDIHDVNEKNDSMSWRGLLFVQVCHTLERGIGLTAVTVITVSKGLATIYWGRIGIAPSVVYSLPRTTYDKATLEVNKRSRLIYFGQLSNDRLPIWCVKLLCQAGWVVDVAGRFKKGTEGYATELIRLVTENGGQMLGEYSASDLGFLRKYAASLMIFESKSSNIKHCMPNKLFQSLGHGVPCVVSESLLEVQEEFKGTGAVVPLGRLLKHGVAPCNGYEISRKLLAMQKESMKSLRRLVD